MGGERFSGFGGLENIRKNAVSPTLEEESRSDDLLIPPKQSCVHSPGGQRLDLKLRCLRAHPHDWFSLAWEGASQANFAIVLTYRTLVCVAERPQEA